jgi:hypothetical protein
MLPNDVEDRDRLVAGRLLLKLEYPCSVKALAHEHQIELQRLTIDFSLKMRRIRRFK